MIEDLLEHIGIEDLLPGDTEIGARCPLHEERTGEREHRPRHFSINRRTGMFHCFSCGYSGSLIRLIVDVSKVGLWDAHRMMRRFDVELGEVEEKWEPPQPRLDVATKLAQFGPPPERALSHRRLTTEAIEKFGVRWDPEEAAWILPIYGPNGELWGWQAKASEWVRNRPPGVRKSMTLFGIQVPPRNTVAVILVESPIDAVYLDALGYTALASFGAAVSDAQMRLIIERFDDLILALDNDRAGREETFRLLEERWHHRISTQIFNYGHAHGKDPGELSAKEIDQGIKDITMAGFW